MAHTEEQGPADARFSRNPVWLLLKGVEGFDTERASECLVRLLGNHYDNISVLKLATKRDLVDDAGILPGDALRIVAAAKEYDAPRDPGPEPTLQCGHGGKPAQVAEHSQDMYRTPGLCEAKSPSPSPWTSPSSSQAHSPTVMQPQQQKGVASRQEAVKEGKVVDQVGPREEPVKQDPTLPPLRGAFEDGRTGYALADARFAPADPTLAPPWRALVDGKTGCIYYWNPVLNTTQYNKPLPFVGSGPSFLSASLPPGPPSSVTSAPRTSAATSQPIPPGISYPHICRLCNDICSTEDQMRAHYNGQRHDAAFQKAKQSVINRNAVNPTIKETRGVAHPPVVWKLKQPIQPEQAASELMHPLQSSPIAPSLIAKAAAQPPVVGELKQPTQPEQPASELTQPLQSSPIAASLHACGVCNVRCNSEIVLRSHFNGKKHAGNMKTAVDNDDNQSTQYLYCSICDVTCPCKRALVLHFNGKLHAENMNEDLDSGSSSYYSDTEGSDY